MAFEPGKSGNPKGRPTKEEIALRNMDKGELDKALKKLRPASMEALNCMIAAMHNENIPEKDRLKYAKDVWDAYVKAITVDNALKKSDNAGNGGMSTEDEEDKPAPVVFRIAK